MTNKTISEIIDEALIQLQYGTMMSDNQEPMLTNNRDIAHEAITQAMLDMPELQDDDVGKMILESEEINKVEYARFLAYRNQLRAEIRTAIKKRGE